MLAAKNPSLDETRAGTAAAREWPAPETGVDAMGMTAVSELSVTGLPHTRQNRLVSGISEAQDMQRVIAALCYCSIGSREGVGLRSSEVGGLLRCERPDGKLAAGNKLRLRAQFQHDLRRDVGVARASPNPRRPRCKRTGVGSPGDPPSGRGLTTSEAPVVAQLNRSSK